MMMAAVPAVSQQLALTQAKPDCAIDEPDPVQISWTAPCDSGNWLLEPGVGCRMWDWHPDAQDKATWSGTCQGELKGGHGVLLWTEHGKAIDRFVGTYRNGRREGAGRYDWNEADHFEGTYANDLPNGFGSVSLGGTKLSGQWRDGCLAVDDKMVAIGVTRESCEQQQRQTATN